MSRFPGNLGTRRDFLRLLASSLAIPTLGRFAFSADPTYPFSEVPSSASGITWKHTAGLSPEKYLPQSTGAGCAFLDYDNDGWMDLYFVNSGPCDIFTPTQPLRNALYRNNRDGTFTDVTEKAGVAGGGYGMGVAVGDYNGDGFPDLYVTQYGRSILYRNNGDGTFTDVTEHAGVAAPGWASSAVWFDYDNDGRLDLFVCRFVDFDKSKHHNCGAPNIPAIKGLNEYCYPRIFSPMASWLFHNNGDGTFSDVSQKMGIADNPGKSWGVVATDVNNDGWMDLFVANDTVANFLFINRGGKHFEEVGFTSGVAFGEGGKARSGMGVDSAVLIEIGGIHAHAGAGLSTFSESNAGGESNFFKSLATAIHEQEIGERVVGHEKVHPAVVVDISRNHAPGFPGIIGNSHLLADVGERAVTVIVKQPAGHRSVYPRITVFI